MSSTGLRTAPSSTSVHSRALGPSSTRDVPQLGEERDRPAIGADRADERPDGHLDLDRPGVEHGPRPVPWTRIRRTGPVTDEHGRALGAVQLDPQTTGVGRCLRRERALLLPPPCHVAQLGQPDGRLEPGCGISAGPRSVPA